MRIETPQRFKVWKGSYDFAVDGGLVSTIVLRSSDGDIPLGAVVMGGFLDIITALTSSGSATGAIQTEAANDTINQAAYGGAPWSSTGRKSIIPAFTGATSLKTTAVRQPSFLIGTAALTAGKFDLYIVYL